MADRINNFKKLMEDDYENRFQLPEMRGASFGGANDPIEAHLLKRHATMRLNSEVTDLFIPKMFRTVMSLFGGEAASDDDIPLSRPAPDWGYSAPSEPKAPGQR